MLTNYHSFKDVCLIWMFCCCIYSCIINDYHPAPLIPALVHWAKQPPSGVYLIKLKSILLLNSWIWSKVFNWKVKQILAPSIAARLKTGCAGSSCHPSRAESKETGAHLGSETIWALSSLHGKECKFDATCFALFNYVEFHTFTRKLLHRRCLSSPFLHTCLQNIKSVH